MIRYRAMRKLGLPLIGALMAVGAHAQTACDSLVSYRVGERWDYQWYNAEREATYLTNREVTAIDTTAEGVLVSVRMEAIDELRDTVFIGTYQVRCGEDFLTFDLLSRLTPSMLSSLAALELSTQGAGWRLPLRLLPGDTIPPTYARVVGARDGTQVLQLDLGIGATQVLANEDLVTPAGAFPCVALAYELRVTTLVRKRFRLRDWWSPGTGVIRRELFDRYGRFYGYCELVRHIPKK